jgi:hypothetical protein
VIVGRRNDSTKDINRNLMRAEDTSPHRDVAGASYGGESTQTKDKGINPFRYPSKHKEGQRG